MVLPLEVVGVAASGWVSASIGIANERRIHPCRSIRWFYLRSQA